MHAAQRSDWVRDAVARSWDEVRAYVRTGVAFTLNPARFAMEWIARHGAVRRRRPGRRGGARRLCGRDRLVDGLRTTRRRVIGVPFGLKPSDVPFGTRVLVRFHPLRASTWVD